MKTEFKSKFLQHLASKKKEEGFTLIELLVVIIIIGILAAIALPSFLNQAAKAKQSEAKNTVGSFIRAQQAYRLANTTFANSFNLLESEVAIVSKTPNYTFNISSATTDITTMDAAPADPKTLKKYQGRVQVLASGGSASGACEANDANNAAATVNNIPNNGVASCSAGRLLGT